MFVLYLCDSLVVLINHHHPHWTLDSSPVLKSEDWDKNPISPLSVFIGLLDRDWKLSLFLFFSTLAYFNLHTVQIEAFDGITP